ncbi:hypothetical protein [Acidiphilium sp.]|uniref:hypothetical protein n=1 Tax=Acidiphilium sp. TaxID=527 RepID=UPI003CFE95B2
MTNPLFAAHMVTLRRMSSVLRSSRDLRARGILVSRRILASGVNAGRSGQNTARVMTTMSWGGLINLLSGGRYPVTMTKLKLSRWRMLKCLHLDVVGMPVVVLVVSTVAVLAVMMAPPAQGPVAAVFPPWWSGARALQAAASAGAVLRFGGYRFVVVALPRRRVMLERAGAWVLLDPLASGICG